MGLTLEAIANNSDGLVVTEGPLAGVNTSGLTEGGLVFLSETTGQLTSTRPTQPAHGVVLGWCVKTGAGTSGILYVKVDNGQELDELHDVLISSATPGQVLRRASSGLWINQTLTAGDVGADPTGTAAAAITAHLAAVDPHPTYLTQTEAGALYAPLASVRDPVTLGATVADVLGLTGQQLTADDPGAGADRLVFWDHSAGRLRHLTLGANLTITDTSIDAAGGTGPGGYPTFAAPTGFTVTGSGTASITLSFATGYSLPTTASQTSWDAAYSERLRWDGGATGLNAVTARASLELGTAATRDAGTAAGNVPILDSSALIPSALLPGFVDDVLEFASLAAFPVTGEAGKLYINLATNRQYRWSGSTYAEINPSPGSTDAVPEGSVNLYFTSARGQSAASSWWSGYRSTVGDQLATTASQAAARSVIGITIGTAAGNVIALDGAGKLPAVDGSQLTNLPGGSGGTSSAVRIDSTSTANTIYVGKAPAGSSESSAVWVITRTQFSAAGVQTGSSTITAVTWTGRTTHTYPS
jgi:hypothetical protein